MPVSPLQAPPATVTASQVPYLFKVGGRPTTKPADAVNGVRISSLTLRHAAPTFMANYSVGSGGDYAVHRVRRHGPRDPPGGGAARVP